MFKGVCLIFLLALLGFFLLNALYKQTNHYQNTIKKFAHLKKVPYNLQIVNLGSSYSYYSYDYTGAGIKNGYNLGIWPQYIMGDYQMLHNFKSHLQDHAIVLINLSFLVFGTFAGLSSHSQDKYYFILEPEHIYQYNPFHMLTRRYFPILGNYRLLKKIIRDVNKAEFPEKMADADELCKKRVNGICREFHLKDLKDVAQLRDLQEEFNQSQKVLKELLAYCKQCSFRPVIIVPPVSPELVNSMSDAFFQKCIKDNILTVSGSVPVFDYWKEEEFQDDKYFWDPLFLNRDGRIRFTKRVLNDLENAGYHLKESEEKYDTGRCP